MVTVTDELTDTAAACSAVSANWLCPCASGGGTFSTTGSANWSEVNVTCVIGLCCRSAICVSCSAASPAHASATGPTCTGMVRLEPTACPNGVVHAVARSPSTALVPRASGTPVRRRLATGRPVQPAMASINTSPARSASRRVTVASNARATGNENSRRRLLSGSARQRLVGRTRSRVITIATGRVSSMSSRGRCGRRVYSAATGPSSANPTALKPLSVPSGRSATASMVSVTGTPAATATGCPGATNDRSSRSTMTEPPPAGWTRTRVMERLLSGRWSCNRVSAPSVDDSSIDSPTGFARSATRHAVLASPSTAMAGRSSGRYANSSPYELALTCRSPSNTAMVWSRSSVDAIASRRWSAVSVRVTSGSGPPRSVMPSTSCDPRHCMARSRLLSVTMSSAPSGNASLFRRSPRPCRSPAYSTASSPCSSPAAAASTTPSPLPASTTVVAAARTMATGCSTETSSTGANGAPMPLCDNCCSSSIEMSGTLTFGVPYVCG